MIPFRWERPYCRTGKAGAILPRRALRGRLHRWFSAARRVRLEQRRVLGPAVSSASTWSPQTASKSIVMPTITPICTGQPAMQVLVSSRWSSASGCVCIQRVCLPRRARRRALQVGARHQRGGGSTYRISGHDVLGRFRARGWTNRPCSHHRRLPTPKWKPRRPSRYSTPARSSTRHLSKLPLYTNRYADLVFTHDVPTTTSMAIGHARTRPPWRTWHPASSWPMRILGSVRRGSPATRWAVSMSCGLPMIPRACFTRGWGGFDGHRFLATPMR